MKLLPASILICGVVYLSGNTIEKQVQAQMYLVPEIISSDSTLQFKENIQPIFVNHCSPCHFTGGKMYERLPFDKAQTILDNPQGILRRIKDEKEVILIKLFAEQHKK